MWTYSKTTLSTGIIGYQLFDADKQIRYCDWIDLIQNSNAFIAFFIRLLQDSDFEAYFWEVKPVTTVQLSEHFEFVLVRGDYLMKLNSNRRPFEAYFSEDATVVSFNNLRGDAQLVVPSPISDEDHYTYLARFVRNAPENQVTAFFKRVGKEYASHICEARRWLSTAGLGVYWLHVRIDSRPKYYKYEGYKDIT